MPEPLYWEEEKFDSEHAELIPERVRVRVSTTFSQGGGPESLLRRRRTRDWSPSTIRARSTSFSRAPPLPAASPPPARSPSTFLWHLRACEHATRASLPASRERSRTTFAESKCVPACLLADARATTGSGHPRRRRGRFELHRLERLFFSICKSLASRIDDRVAALLPPPLRARQPARHGRRTTRRQARGCRELRWRRHRHLRERRPMPRLSRVETARSVPDDKKMRMYFASQDFSRGYNAYMKGLIGSYVHGSLRTGLPTVVRGQTPPEQATGRRKGHTRQGATDDESSLRTQPTPPHRCRSVTWLIPARAVGFGHRG